MSYLALYRKYRPIDFENVYGQDEVVTVIRNAIVSGKISHAYLFCGPRGTGKTTIAKIIARLVNCDNLVDGNPCGKCYNCLNYLNSNDIVEIDAASNNGVDEIRELRDKVNLVPSNSKFKVYIIDEVHMLTTQAFNALLKTLEEPPSHVIFILATTEPHKIPLTISSRCQKFRFSKISDEKIVQRLKNICELEDISIDDDALFEIARFSDGGMRDAINFLDQLRAFSDGNIKLDDVYKVNSSVSYKDLYDLLTYVYDNDKVNIIKFIDYLNNSGKDIGKFTEELLIFIKDVVIFKNANIGSNISTKNEYLELISDKYSDSDLYNFIDNLNTVQNLIKYSGNGSILLLASLLKFSDFNFKKNDNIILENKVDDKENISREINVDFSDSESDIKNCSLGEEEIEIRINNALALASKQILDNFKNKWNLIDDYIGDSKFSVVSGLLKDSSIVVGSDGYVILSNRLQSVVDRMNSNFCLIEELLEKVFGSKVLVVVVNDEKWKIIRNKYVNDFKNGVKYSVKVISNSNDTVMDSSKNSVDELIDLVGSNVIVYK